MQPNPIPVHQSRRTQLLHHPALPAIASALLAVVLYAITLRGTYVYDDIFIVREDPRVRQPSQWIQLWKTDYFNGGIDNLYRPLLSSTYAFEWWIHGDRPWIFHAVNILLHALAAAGIAELTRRALGKTSFAWNAALCGGLLFAAHPVHTEAVANIVGRAELLCTVFIFTGMILLCRRPLTLGRVALIITIGILAVLSKEQGILQPLLWLFFGLTVWKGIRPHEPVESTPEDQPIRDSSKLDYARPSRKAPAVRERNAVKIFVMVTCWVWAGYLILREHFLKFEWDRTYIDPIIQPLILSQGIDRVLMPVVLLGHYTALLIWPNHLAADYGGDVIGSVARASDLYLWIGFLTMIFWILTLLVCLKQFLPQRRREAEKSRPNFLSPLFSSPRLRVSAVQNCPTSSTIKRFILFSLLSLAITYGIVGNILTLIATNFAERLIYLPSAFFLMIVGTLLAMIPYKPRMLLLTVLLIPASIRTTYAARDWNTPRILFQHGLASQPKSVQLHFLLAQQYHQQGNIAQANALLQEVCRLYPNYWRAWMLRANEDLDDGNLTDAEQSLKHALKLKADMSLIDVQDRLEKMKAATRPAIKP
jgi:hypothetical protein